MYDLDGGHEMSGLCITDSDQETTWFRLDDIAMFAADRCALYPEMRDAERELQELAE
jgi:hypothetical protein